MRKRMILIAVAVVVLIFPLSAQAHFGMLIPTDSMVMPGENPRIELLLAFAHPFAGEGMEMARPKVFGMAAGGKKVDLQSVLKKTRFLGHTAWQAGYRITRPGVYTFYMQPTPYWEPAEDIFIIHYTKCVVAAFGDEEGWDAPVGMKTEIVPLARPFGLYTGNVFQGIVQLNGKPVPFAPVEVEHFNREGVAAPTDYMITQTLKADANGVFTYAPPAAGWWGFAALNPAGFKLKHAGNEKDVELGAVIWVRFLDWKK